MRPKAARARLVIAQDIVTIAAASPEARRVAAMLHALEQGRRHAQAAAREPGVSGGELERADLGVSEDEPRAVIVERAREVKAPAPEIVENRGAPRCG